MVASCLSTAFRRCSKSPRYLVPASRAPMSRAKTWASARISGTGPRRCMGQALRRWRSCRHGLADQQRVVLAAAEGLDDALDFLLAADQRVDLAEQGLLVEVLRVLSRAPPGSAFLFLLALFGFAFRGGRAAPDCGVLVMPWEMKLTTSRREMFCAGGNTPRASPFRRRSPPARWRR